MKPSMYRKCLYSGPFKCINEIHDVHRSHFLHPLTNGATIFIQIVAMATTNFSLAGVRLLIEGGSYSRVAFLINFERLPLGAIHKIVT